MPWTRLSLAQGKFKNIYDRQMEYEPYNSRHLFDWIICEQTFPLLVPLSDRPLGQIRQHDIRGWNHYTRIEFPLFPQWQNLCIVSLLLEAELQVQLLQQSSMFHLGML